MEYDLDYEIYKYINKLAEDYIDFDELLKQHNITQEKALQKAEHFRNYFNGLISEYSIGDRNIVVTCCDLIERISSEPYSKDLWYIFFCIVTDTGLLTSRHTGEWSDERKVRNYFRQSEIVGRLSDFFESQSVNRKKLLEIRKYLKKSVAIRDTDCSKEADFLYNLTIQHDFLHESIGNQVYKDNLNALITHINGDEKLRSVKPYLVFAVISRKTGMFQNRKYFMPNLKAVLQYQNYNIYHDNGKNFDTYQSVIELYDHIRNSYQYDENIDMELCDFCFANLSPLSEWFYIYCEHDFEIPMTFCRKVLLSESLNFPDIEIPIDYEANGFYEFETGHSEIIELWEKIVTPEMTENFLNLLYSESDTTQITAKLPYYSEYPVYSEMFMYFKSETLLHEKMTALTENLFGV